MGFVFITRKLNTKEDTIKIIAGVDEAGRGPLAGPVVAAVVILPKNHGIIGITDSKKLTAKKRDILFEKIIARASAYAIAQASAQEIDEINILQASLLAMRRAVLALSITPDEVWVDGNQKPNIPYFVKTIIQGDLTEEVIGAASILAKVTRDRDMECLEASYPGYGFSQHKGYPTKAHVEALQRLGASDIHRRSFGPVKKIMTLPVSDTAL